MHLVSPDRLQVSGRGQGLFGKSFEETTWGISFRTFQKNALNLVFSFGRLRGTEKELWFIFRLEALCHKIKFFWKSSTYKDSYFFRLTCFGSARQGAPLSYSDVNLAYLPLVSLENFWVFLHFLEKRLVSLRSLVQPTGPTSVIGETVSTQRLFFSAVQLSGIHL